MFKQVRIESSQAMVFCVCVYVYFQESCEKRILPFYFNAFIVGAAVFHHCELQTERKKKHCFYNKSVVYF